MASKHIDRTGHTRLHLWYCGACEAIHLNAGPVRLTFDRAEFGTFLRAAVNAHYAGSSLSNTRSMTADHVDIEAKETTALIQLLQ